MSRYASRKFLLAVGTVTATTVLVWYGKVADGVFSAVVIAVAAAYLGANVAQKASAKGTP